MANVTRCSLDWVEVGRTSAALLCEGRAVAVDRLLFFRRRASGAVHLFCQQRNQSRSLIRGQACKIPPEARAAPQPTLFRTCLDSLGKWLSRFLRFSKTHGGSPC